MDIDFKDWCNYNKLFIYGLIFFKWCFFMIMVVNV